MINSVAMPVLQKNSKIVIVAPAGSVKLEEIETTLQWLNSQGWRTELKKNVFNEYNFGYNYAGNDAERIADFQNALDDEEADVIWCARGGYGGVHLIDKLNFTKFYKKPKWVIGYSDNTVFHQYLSKQNIPSLHGLVLKPLPQNHSEESYNSILQILCGNRVSYEFQSHHFSETGEMKGIISGGNLSIIYSLMGSKTFDDFTDKILFIEDWYENWYHLDRMMMCLDRAGIFKKIQGIIVGGFTKMDDKAQDEYENPFDTKSYEIIKQRLQQYSFPKLFGFPCGHIYDNRALVFGKEVNIKITKKKHCTTILRL